MKTCFKCKTEKPTSEFYRHKAMGDGFLGKCKECTRADVIANRAARLEYYTNYDKHRAMQPHRVAARHQYLQTEAGKQSRKRSTDRWQSTYPKKRHASHMVNNAVRDGKIEKQYSCSECGRDGVRIHGHHDDYGKPLEVRWLCSRCHTAWHRENGEGRNAA